MEGAADGAARIARESTPPAGRMGSSGLEFDCQDFHHWKGNAGVMVVSDSDARPATGLVHHGTGYDDDLCASIAAEHQLISDAIRKGLTVQAHNQARALKALDRAALFL